MDSEDGFLQECYDLVVWLWVVDLLMLCRPSERPQSPSQQLKLAATVSKKGQCKNAQGTCLQPFEARG